MGRKATLFPVEDATVPSAPGTAVADWLSGVPFNSRTCQALAILTVMGALLVASLATAQPPPTQQPDAEPEALAAALRTAERAEEVATLSYANRPVLVFRATVLSRAPSERAAGAVTTLDRLVDDVPRGLVGTSTIGDAYLLTIDGHPVFAVVPEDVDPLAGETTAGKAAEAASRLQVAFDEAVEIRNPSRLLRSGLLALAATLVYFGALLLLRRAHRASATRLGRRAQRQVERLSGGAVIVHASSVPRIVRRMISLVAVILALLLTDFWLTFVLNRFPYTRPWGESLRASALSAILSAGRAVGEALPGLLTVLVIVLITRFLVRLTTLLFDGVGAGRFSLPGVYPETVQPTRRIVVALLWLFALIMSYRYIPGSDSDAFKGVSVFVGLMVSLGSTGIMNQLMSGLTITYSRALRLGDFVRVGDVEGTVTHLGTLATKVKTLKREEITIPNAVVVSSATTNYSRHAETEGVLVGTSVAIGYDAPWRQVRALLLLAAERTPQIRRTPEPVVRQTALEDSYVQYMLLVCLDQPHLRVPVLDVLHANIQDAFNEYGVQIMTPNYEGDPNAPKVVPRERWYAAPATLESEPPGADAGGHPPPSAGDPATSPTPA